MVYALLQVKNVSKYIAINVGILTVIIYTIEIVIGVKVPAKLNKSR